MFIVQAPVEIGGGIWSLAGTTQHLAVYYGRVEI